MLVPYEQTTSTASIKSEPAFLGLVILKAGSANATLEIDDSADGTGDVKAALAALANDSRVVSFLPEGIPFGTGIFSTLTGAGAKAYIYLK